MMKEPAVVKNADGGDKCRADQDTGNLHSRRPLKSQQNGNYDRGIHGQAPQERNRRLMYFSRAGEVHHADAQSEGTYRNDQHHGSEQSNEESEQACGHATPFHTEKQVPPRLVRGATSVILAGFGSGSQVRNLKWLPPRSANTIPRFLSRGNARKTVLLNSFR